MDIATTEFYASLLIEDAPSHARVEARDVTWQCTLILVDSNKQGLLDAPFTNSAFKFKCTGSDGLVAFSFLFGIELEMTLPQCCMIHGTHVLC